MTNVQKFETLEDAVTAFSEQSKPILKKFARHQHFSPDSQKRRPAMHKRTKDSKGKRR